MLTKFFVTGLNNWLINAFNGEWLKTKQPVPIEGRGVVESGREKLRRELDDLMELVD